MKSNDTILVANLRSWSIEKSVKQKLSQERHQAEYQAQISTTIYI